MKKLFILITLGFVLSINFLLFQNFSVNNGTPPAATAPLSALAIVERTLVELNQYTNDPSLNALMVMSNFSITNVVAVYLGNYNALSFSIEATKYAIEKFDRYEVSGFTNMNKGDVEYVQALRNSIRPFVNSIFIPNIPYVMPLTPDISLEATPGVLTFVTYDEAGKRVFTKTYDYTNFYRLGQEVNAQMARIKRQSDPNSTVYEPIPRYLSAFDDDERDLYDRSINTTKVLLQELGVTGDGKVSINDLVNGDVILNPSQMSVPDLVPIGFDLAGAPIFSKITYSSKSSFDPEKYSFEAQGKIVASSDPYDTAISTPDPINTGGGDGSSSGGSSSGSGSGGNSGSTDAWYDSYDDSTTDTTTPTTPGGSGGSSGSGGTTPTTPPGDGHTYGGEGE